MCRALLVVCVAPDRESLVELKRSTVGTDWELTPGATSAADAVAQIEDRGAHVLVAAGSLAADAVVAVSLKKKRMHVVAVSDEPVEGADAVVATLDEVRGAVKGLPSPGGPVRS